MPTINPKRMPVIVGVSQITGHDDAPATARSPLELMCEAARLAAGDATATRPILPELGSIAVIRSFSDTAPAFRSPFGRLANAPWSVARRIGAGPRELIYPAQGGDTPQLMVRRACEQIAGGAVASAMIVGAEAMRTERNAVRAGIQLDWSEDAPAPPDELGGVSQLYSQAEIDHGMRSAVAMYALIEQSLRAGKSLSPEARAAELGALFERFADTARDNPFAMRREGYRAAEIAAASQANRYVGYPYTRLMTANMYVDQAAAIILCSREQADAWGVPLEKRVYLRGAAEGHDEWFVTERRRLDISPAIKAVANAALDAAGIRIDDVAHIDLYSCFACAVEIAADAIGIAADDPRGLTVTGGLPFFGGPGNNYVTHAIAETVTRVRARPGSYGLVTANGGLLTKHAAGIYSNVAPGEPASCSPAGSLQAEIDAASGPKVELEAQPAGKARIETYTVLHGRAGAERGIVIGRLAESGRRFVANTPPDRDILAGLERMDAIGLGGTVTSDGRKNVFSPDFEGSL